MRHPLPHRCHRRCSRRPPAPGVIRAPDAALLEPAPDFPDRFLPKRAADGRASMSFYARAPDLMPKRPSVAMLVVGLGQSASDSGDAIETVAGGGEFRVLAVFAGSEAVAGRAPGRMATNIW